MARRLKDKPLPKVLYKYRDWEDDNHKKIITNQEIYFSSPAHFNDPFDGNVPTRYDQMTYEDCLEMNLKLLNTIHSHRDQKLVLEYAKKLTDEKKLWHPDKLKKESPKQLDEWNKRIGLFSLSESPNNALMWAHYSKNHTGFAIGLNSERIMENSYFEFVDYIHYNPTYPKITGKEDSIGRFHKKFFFKSDVWEYEKEWRITKNHIKNRVYKLDMSMICEVIIGCEADEKRTEEIVTAIKLYLHSDVNIFKVKKFDFTFDLKVERL